VAKAVKLIEQAEEPPLLADLADAVDHIDAHNATRGCFAARVERA
jgi:truncated hemoglobin YjbI